MAAGVSLGFMAQGHELNVLENGRKGGYFGEARSSLPLLFCYVLQAMYGPIVLIRNVSIFSFSLFFLKTYGFWRKFGIHWTGL